MHVVLVEPKIPPNTGNIARLCAATKTKLHLVGELGFEITDRRVKRAGLDYWKHVQIERHSSLKQFLGGIQATRLFFFSTKGKMPYVQARFQEDDFLIFGSETSGLPKWILEQYSDGVFRIPILCSGVRSLNLSNAVAIIAYEALRQTGKLI
jgi:tRNA (cytidine/uridine-2'-O-)-methyltransferase